MSAKPSQARVPANWLERWLFIMHVVLQEPCTHDSIRIVSGFVGVALVPKKNPQIQTRNSLKSQNGCSEFAYHVYNLLLGYISSIEGTLDHNKALNWSKSLRVLSCVCSMVIWGREYMPEWMLKKYSAIIYSLRKERLNWAESAANIWENCEWHHTRLYMSLLFACTSSHVDMMVPHSQTPTIARNSRVWIGGWKPSISTISTKYPPTLWGFATQL